MKILIGAGISFLHQLNEFSKELSKHGVECKVVIDRDYIGEFPSKELKGLFRTRKKFERLISTFKPDVVLIDRMSKFGLEVIKSGIPLFLIVAKSTLFQLLSFGCARVQPGYQRLFET